MNEPTHYECCCGELFPCEEAFIQGCPEPVEFWGQSAIRDGYIPCCSSCGSDELDDAWLCERCQIRRATEEGTDLCAVCAAEESKADAMWDQQKEQEMHMEPF